MPDQKKWIAKIRPVTNDPSRWEWIAFDTSPHLTKHALFGPPQRGFARTEERAAKAAKAATDSLNHQAALYEAKREAERNNPWRDVE